VICLGLTPANRADIKPVGPLGSPHSPRFGAGRPFRSCYQTVWPGVSTAVTAPLPLVDFGPIDEILILPSRSWTVRVPHAGLSDLFASLGWRCSVGGLPLALEKLQRRSSACPARNLRATSLVTLDPASPGALVGSDFFLGPDHRPAACCPGSSAVRNRGPPWARGRLFERPRRQPGTRPGERP